LEGVSNISTELIPIGLVQNAQVNQGKQIQQLFELGSKRPIQLPGRTSIQASMSRVLFDGPSLFFALYRTKDGNHDTIPQPSSFGNTTNNEISNPTSPYPDDGQVTNREQDPDTGDIQVHANPGHFWSNLRSEIFNKPLGLGLVMFDMEGDPYGGLYLEQVYVRGHTLSVSSQQTVLMENVNMVATQLRPLTAEALDA
jgi:hypothetical protein